MHSITKKGEVFQILNIKLGSAVFGWVEVASCWAEQEKKLVSWNQVDAQKMYNLLKKKNIIWTDYFVHAVTTESEVIALSHSFR